MNKFISHLPSTHLILVRKQLSDGSVAALLVMRAPVGQYGQRRQYAAHNQPCPPTPPVRSNKLRRFLYGAVAASIIGAGVVYAKHSPETRNFLESKVPWASRFVGLVYQEEITHYQFLRNQVTNATDGVRNFLFGRDGVSPMDFKQRSEQDLEKEAEITFKERDYKLPATTLEPLYIEEKVVTTPEVEHEATLITTQKCEPPEPPVINVSKEALDLEQEMHESTKLAMDEYPKSLKLCTEYTKALHVLIENPIDTIDKNSLAKVKTLATERDKSLKVARTHANKARCAIDSLERMIENSKLEAPMENIVPTKRYIKQFRQDLDVSEKKVEEEMEKAVLADKYWEKVEAARNMYKEQLEIAFPGIDLSARKLTYNGSTDLFILFTMKQVQYLQNALAEMQTVREYKIRKAIECGDEEALIQAKVEDEVMKERLKRDLEFQKLALKLTAESQQKTREELRRQYEYQEEITRARLAKKEQELAAKFNRRVSEEVEQERVIYKRELAAMAGKLQAIEQTLKKRAAAEESARKSQTLWAAAEALLAATRRPGETSKIDNEVKALEKAASGDYLATTVVKGINNDVRKNGVVTEKHLRDRFDQLEKTATKVALIGKEGASLPMYFLSWVQSKLLFQKFADIPLSELENRPTDFTKLDTFDIMQRARYHLDHNDLSSALRYVNLLQGAPRAAAKNWVESARQHLEVRQAAETVMAHASLSGMLYS